MNPPWHALTPDEVLSRLQTRRDTGLSEAVAAQRLAADGPNEIPRPQPVPAWRRFLGQFHNILIYVLLASAVGAFALGDGIDAWVILGVVLINAIIGFIQEDKAETALAAIRDLLSLSATAIRGGGRRLLEAEQLVAGDIVMLQAGDKVPADLRLIELKNLAVDESALTGESGSVFKSPGPMAEETVLAERTCMAYSGSLVVSGQGLGVVVATGGRTELGRISAMLSQVEGVETPLQRQFAVMARWLTLVILLLSAAIFAYGLWARGHELQAMFMAMVAIAVAAVPEGLPAVVTITLAVGVQRMARRNAIVRYLPAVETLGEVTVICSDKTGTLTANVMAVRDLVTAGGQYGVEGYGYGGDGHITGPDGEPAETGSELQRLIRTVLLCNDACLHPDPDGVKLDGDPTEGALLSLGLKAGMDQQTETARAPRIDSIPFESERRYMSTLHRLPDRTALVCLKGAPEAVLPLCGAQLQGGDAVTLDRAYWVQHAERLAKAGERVIAAAYKTLAEVPAGLEQAPAADGYVLAGLCGLIDPPREEAVQAIKSCREAQIRVKMITGDHGLTAKAIGTHMNLADDCRVLLGSAIEAMNDADLAVAVQSHDIFARTSPEHKLRLVQALQSDGQVVAMTGDGVNDAPALKAADIGVAMGQKGSEVAKDAAVMVLADDNFASIAHAVEEGRTLHDNLLKAIVFILPTSFAQAGAVVVGLLLGVTLPITPLQILWVNLVTAVTLSMSLAFEPPEAAVMKRPPRRPGQPLLGWFSLWRILFVTALLVAGLMGVYLYQSSLGASLAESRTAAVNALIAGEIVYLFNSRYIEASVLSVSGLFGNRYALLTSALLVALQLVMTYVPWVQGLFGTAALDRDTWLLIAGFGVAVFVVVELEKALLRLIKRFRTLLAEVAERGVARQRDRRSLTRFAWLSIAAALVTIGLKTAAYQLTGSVGLLSDALESLVNLVAALMALAMLVVAERPPDAGHHFGHGKAEYFSSGLEGALIMIAAAGIGITAYDRLLHPQPLNELDVGVAISCLAALINFWVASVLLRVGRRYGSITLEADARHLLTDVWTSLGVVTGLGAVYFSGWQVLDPIIALVVAVHIVWSGFRLLKRSVAGLLDATLPAEENARIAEVLDRYRRQGIQFHDLRTRPSGVYRFMTVHVLVPGSMTVQQGHDLVDRIERDICAAVGEITVVSHLEPLEDPASFGHARQLPDEAGAGEKP